MSRKWSRSHELQVRRILELMRAEAHPFADCSPEAVAARKALPFDAWIHTYFPHYAYCPSSQAHLDADILIEQKGIPIFEFWFRGAGKTVRALLRRIRRILETQSRFIVVAGQTEDNGADKMDMMKLELQHNQRLRQDYSRSSDLSDLSDRSDIAPRLGDNEDTDWIAVDTRVLARGIGQTCRGVLHGPNRPDDFLADDLEDEMLARNPAREKHLWDWIFGNVFPALEGAGMGAYCELLLNNFGTNCCLKRVARLKAQEKDSEGRPICLYIEYLAEDDKGNSTWEERFPTKALRRMAAVMGIRLYRREMLGKEEDDEAIIRPEWPREFDSRKFDRSTAEVRVGCDPAVAQSGRACFKAIIVLARPVGTADRFCLHAWLRNNASPREFVEHMIWVFDTFGPPRVGCEVNGIGAMVRPLLALVEELQRRVDAIGLYPINNTENKDDRIARMAPIFEAGHAYFDPSEGDQRVLLDQWLDFGKTGVAKDGPDAWEMTDRQFPRYHAGKPQAVYTSGATRTRYEALV